jgi:hypothetical protein
MDNSSVFKISVTASIMNHESHKPKLSPALSVLLDKLRKRIRAYVWVEGAAALAVVIGLGFWLSLGFDWVFEPPAFLRASMLAIVAIGFLAVLYRFILRRAFVHLADRSMALVLERRFGDLGDSLLTVVELSEHGEQTNEFSPAMLAETERDALSGAESVRLNRVFNLRPLVRRAALAVLLVASMIGFGVAASEAFGIWVRRSLLFSEEQWPRKTRLVVEGFEEQSRKKVARGSDVDLVVKADAALGRFVPDAVVVRFSSADGARVRENMSRQGEAVVGRDPFQAYAYTFRSVLAPLEFYLIGGDDRVGPFQLDVVDSPTINQMTLHCEYPTYMRLAPRDLPVSGIMPVPFGTRITVRAQANKDLREAQIDEVLDGAAPTTHKLRVDSGKNSRQFEFTIEKLTADATLLVTLFDTDGIRSRDPVRLSLSAVADEVPRVGARLVGIGTAITPAARLPMVGDIEDDYAISRAWFQVQIDDGTPREQPFSSDPAGKGKVQVDESLEVGPLELKPKQKLHLLAQAADTYDLADKPNVGTSQKYVLDVVTPADLRSMLEARELQLRRRFETIFQEFTDTRDLLARVETGPIGDSAAPKPEAPPETTKDSQPGNEPGDERSEKAGRNSPSAETLAANRKVQAARVSQNSGRTADETRGLADAFDEIRAELINNRVDTEELKTRLKDGISDPLRRIADARFPELLARLKKLESVLDNPAAAPAAQDAARDQADIILVEMKQVLDNMLELETFNEALEMLRGIIKLQGELNNETRERQKSKLRDLLEE